ncbi:MAG: LysR substrate-binding domain-containing protein [Lachnospiraceae bacterium]|nr:LysR substrate-binding domain-containing protein [Lachnospiraceae bacterium]
MPNTHPFAEKKSIQENELYTENIIVCNSYAIPSRAAEVQNRLLQHIFPEATYVSENMQELLTLLRARYGYSILPEMNFMNQEICFIPLVGMTPLSYGIFYKNGSRNPLLKEFVSVLKESTKEQMFCNGG